jgi:hypothetical protein
MTKRLVLAVAFLLSTGIAGADDKDYTSRGGKFSVHFPGKIVEKDVSAAGATGKSIGYEGKDGSLAVVYVDLPEGVAGALKNPEATQVILTTLRDTAIEQMKGKLVEDKKIKLGGAVGLDLTVDLPEKKRMRNQLYVTGARFYQVMVVGSKDFVGSDEASQFLKSFKITK